MAVGTDVRSEKNSLKFVEVSKFYLWNQKKFYRFYKEKTRYIEFLENQKLPLFYMEVGVDVRSEKNSLKFVEVSRFYL